MQRQRGLSLSRRRSIVRWLSISSCPFFSDFFNSVSFFVFSDADVRSTSIHCIPLERLTYNFLLLSLSARGWTSTWTRQRQCTCSLTRRRCRAEVTSPSIWICGSSSSNPSTLGCRRVCTSCRVLCLAGEFAFYFCHHPRFCSYFVHIFSILFNISMFVIIV